MRHPQKLLALLSVLIFAASCGAALGQGQGWIKPNSFSDPENKWVGETKAYSNSTSDFAEDRSNRSGLGAPLTFGFSKQFNCSRVRVFSDYGFNIVDTVIVDLRLAGTNTWVNVHTGAIKNAAWSEIIFPQKTIDGVRYTFRYNSSGWWFWLYSIE